MNAPEPLQDNQNGVDGEETVNSPEEVSHTQVPAQQASMPRSNAMQAQYGLTPEQQQQMAYQQYMQQQNVGGQYPMPPQVRKAWNTSML